MTYPHLHAAEILVRGASETVDGDLNGLSSLRPLCLSEHRLLGLELRAVHAPLNRIQKKCKKGQTPKEVHLVTFRTRTGTPWGRRQSTSKLVAVSHPQVKLSSSGLADHERRDGERCTPNCLVFMISTNRRWRTQRFRKLTHASSTSTRCFPSTHNYTRRENTDG